MKNDDIRWKQRFQNFEKAQLLLRNAVLKETLSELERAGLIQFYQFSFELAWKTLKDFLEENGSDVKFPRDIIRESFQSKLIEDGDLWMDMLEKRNILIHIYDETSAENARKLITEKYFTGLEQVYLTLKKEL